MSLEGEKTSIHDYSDILDMPRPEPRYHQRMPMSERAAQFAPFSALTGYSEVIREMGRITEKKIQLDEREIEAISRKLSVFEADIGQQPEVKITFFVPDSKKEGGSYQTITGKLRKIDRNRNRLLMENDLKINFEDILRIDRS